MRAPLSIALPVVPATFDPVPRAWVVARCPHCGRQHRHRLRKANVHSHGALGRVGTPCHREYRLIAAERHQLRMEFAA